MKLLLKVLAAHLQFFPPKVEKAQVATLASCSARCTARQRVHVQVGERKWRWRVHSFTALSCNDWSASDLKSEASFSGKLSLYTAVTLLYHCMSFILFLFYFYMNVLYRAKVLIHPGRLEVEQVQLGWLNLFCDLEENTFCLLGAQLCTLNDNKMSLSQIL